MPKVTEAHRDARRHEIARAAVACLRRKGFSNTSMADIIAESGLSAGAIYSNFTNKAELARYVASTLVEPRVLELSSATGSPRQVATTMLNGVRGSELEFAVVVQVWAEATVDPELRAVATSVVESLRTAMSTGISGWVAERYPEDPDAATQRFARVLIMLCQGYIVDAALFGAGDPAEYLDSASALLE
jgi:AcrR family transcriptional regulator